MSLEDILKTKDPKDFANQQVFVWRDEEYVNVQIVGPQNNFPTLMGLRKEGKKDTPEGVEHIRKKLNTTGFLAANLGISAILTIDYKGERYVTTVQQHRKDLGDNVAKLISGYVDAKHLAQPVEALVEELCEEIVPTTKDGKVVPIKLNGHDLPKPYEKSVQYDEKQKLEVILEKGYQAPGTDKKRKVLINGHEVAGNPEIYYQAPSGSAQLIFYCHASLDDLVIDTLNHAEDRLEDGKLNARIHPKGLYLIKMKDGELTSQVYTFSNGKLEPVDPSKIVLSEPFVKSEDGIIAEQNIPLLKYLEQRKK